MGKLKINSGLLSLVLVACLFSGWGTMLTVAVLILVFCEMDERVKNVFVRVLSFFAAITLFTLLWDLITGGVNLAINSIEDLIELINSYLSYDKAITLGKLDSYVFIPVQKAISIADSVISYILMFVEFSFIVSIFLNKPGKPNFIIKKIEEYINSAINFVNSFELGSNYQQPQAQPVYNGPQQPVNPNQPMYNGPQNPSQQNFNQPNI